MLMDELSGYPTPRDAIHFLLPTAMLGASIFYPMPWLFTVGSAASLLYFGYRDYQRYQAKQAEIRALAEQYAKDDILWEACQRKDLPNIQVAIEEGANINCQHPPPLDVSAFYQNNLNRALNTPLHLIVSEKDDSAQQAALPILKYLLSLGADINATNIPGNTPFHIACRYGFIEAAQRLYDRDPSLLRKENLKGETPLFYFTKHADFQNANQLLMLQWLLAKQANPNETAYDKFNQADGERLTPLAFLIKYQDKFKSPQQKENFQAACEMLAQHGAALRNRFTHLNDGKRYKISDFFSSSNKAICYTFYQPQKKQKQKFSPDTHPQRLGEAAYASTQMEKKTTSQHYQQRRKSKKN